MTLSPAFVDEMTVQVRAAREALTVSLAAGDESEVAAARARIDELDEIWTRAADLSLDTTAAVR